MAIRSGLVTPDTAGGPTPTAAGPAAPAAAAVPGAAAPAAAAGPALAPSPPVQLAHLYAGVGVVRGSDPTAEWQELDLKVRSMGRGSGRARGANALKLPHGEGRKMEVHCCNNNQVLRLASRTANLGPPGRSCPSPALPLQIRPLSQALVAAPMASSSPNVNGAWAALLVEELCRLGVNMFCVAPGGEGRSLGIGKVGRGSDRGRGGRVQRSIGW